MNEDRVNQLRALLDAKWGKVGAPSTIVRFPRSKKRGAKVSRGPCAQILHFPAPQTHDDFCAEWSWLSDNYHQWKSVEISGRHDEAKWKRNLMFSSSMGEVIGRGKATDATMREDIAKWRGVIEKRIQVRGWLEDLGVNWKEAFTPEQALFFVFDRMQTQVPLESA